MTVLPIFLNSFFFLASISLAFSSSISRCFASLSWPISCLKSVLCCLSIYCVAVSSSLCRFFSAFMPAWHLISISYTYSQTSALTYIQKVDGLLTRHFTLVNLPSVDFFNPLPEGVKHRFHIHCNFVSICPLLLDRMICVGCIFHKECSLLNLLLEEILDLFWVLNIPLQFKPICVLSCIFLLVFSLVLFFS